MITSSRNLLQIAHTVADTDIDTNIIYICMNIYRRIYIYISVIASYQIQLPTPSPRTPMDMDIKCLAMLSPSYSPGILAPSYMPYARCYMVQPDKIGPPIFNA